jgi:hypothetical protein
MPDALCGAGRVVRPPFPLRWLRHCGRAGYVGRVAEIGDDDIDVAATGTRCGGGLNLAGQPWKIVTPACPYLYLHRLRFDSHAVHAASGQIGDHARGRAVDEVVDAGQPSTANATASTSTPSTTPLIDPMMGGNVMTPATRERRCHCCRRRYRAGRCR